MKRSQIKEKYATRADAGQLLLVECTGGSDAIARYYIKEAGGWRLLHRGSAFIGKNGLGKTGEGDAKTPSGELKPLFAFGIKPNPGTVLPYLRVAPGTFACDGQGPNYNRVICLPDGKDCPGEKMWQLSPEYDWGLQTDFNRECEYPKGSAIFVHCKGAKAYTGGCIALDRRYIRQILRTADYGLRIYIY